MSSPIRPLEDRRLLGIGLALITYLGFAIVDSCAKWLTMSGMPTMQVAFIRYGAQLVIILALFLPRQGRALVRSNNLRDEIVRAVVLVGSTVANFFALIWLPLTTTAAIMFTQPLILCALSIPLLGEQVGWRRWLAILVGFGGVLIVIQPGTESFHPAVFLSLLCSLCGALYLVWTRRLAGVDSTATQQFYACFIATLALAPFAFGGWTWPTDSATWFVLGLIGAAAVVAHLAVTVAHRFAPATVLAPFAYSQMIWMVLSSWLVFNQPPSIWLALGGPIVVGSGLYIWLRERQLGKEPVVAE